MCYLWLQLLMSNELLDYSKLKRTAICGWKNFKEGEMRFIGHLPSLPFRGPSVRDPPASWVPFFLMELMENALPPLPSRTQPCPCPISEVTCLKGFSSSVPHASQLTTKNGVSFNKTRSSISKACPWEKQVLVRGRSQLCSLNFIVVLG